jgi:hypothetical protein
MPSNLFLEGIALSEFSELSSVKSAKLEYLLIESVVLAHKIQLFFVSFSPTNINNLRQVNTNDEKNRFECVFKVRRAWKHPMSKVETSFPLM